MELTFNKRSALTIMRALRSDNARRRRLVRRTNVSTPDMAPMKRWTKNGFELAESTLQLPCSLDRTSTEIAVPSPETRIRTRGVSSTVYERSIPEGAFVDIGNGASISGPELLFTELAASMHPIEHLMLGHELCGTFSRNADNPYNGPVTYGLPPLTSTEKIARFLQQAHRVTGIAAARASLSFLNDNAWSPTESLIAALLRLPVDSLGYEIGALELNPRIPFERNLPGARESRVPDIVIAGTPVGINYDGLVHLDLNSLINAAIELGAHPELAQAKAALDQEARRVRNKAVDDIRRNRELAVDGFSILPLTKEDLYVPNGLSQIVELLIELLEHHDGRDLSWQKKALSMRALNDARHHMVLSLLPGNHERNVQVGRFVGGHPLSKDGPKIHEYWIEV